MRVLCLLLVLAIGACELVLPVHEVADTGADVTVADTSVTDTAADTPFDAPPDGSITGCNALGLVAFYPMDEGDGGVLLDCVSGNNAFLKGPYKWEMRDASPSVTFAAQDGAVDAGAWGATLNAGPAFLTSDGGWLEGTLALWVRIDQSAPLEYIVETRSLNAPADNWELVAVGTTVEFRVGSAKVGVPVSLNTWTHIAAVMRPGIDITMYATGMSPQTLQFDGGQLAGGYRNPLFFGEQEGTQGVGPACGMSCEQFFGGIDDVRIFDRALDGGEISQLATQ